MKKEVSVSYSKWYKIWVTPIQGEFIFKYERPETPKEYEKRVKTYEQEHDERFN